jgi:hypothetical protein
LDDMDAVSEEPHYIGELPININSAYYGESASLCDECFHFVDSATDLSMAELE